MTEFAFSDQTLDALERIQGATGPRRGKVDHKGNRQLADALTTLSSGSTPSRSQRALENLARTARRAPQAVVKITGRIHGSASVLGAFIYTSRLGMKDAEFLPLETSEGDILMRADDMMKLARQWHQHEMSDEARRKGATALSMVFSMPPGTDPDKVRDAVAEYAETDLADRRWVMVLHTDEAHPHVHLIVANRDDEGRRFNPNREFLTQCRARFAENLRARGIDADATKRASRGYPDKGDRASIRKIRERGVSPASDTRRIALLENSNSDLDNRTQARTRTLESFATVKDIYRNAIAELEAFGGEAQLSCAKALRMYILRMPEPRNARHEIVSRLNTENVLSSDHPTVLAARRERSQQAMERVTKATVRLQSRTDELNAQQRRDGKGKDASKQSTALERLAEKTRTLEKLTRDRLQERDREQHRLIDRERDEPSR